VLAYISSRRKDQVFLKLEVLLKTSGKLLEKIGLNE